MLRKHILAKGPTVPAAPREEKDIAALDTVLVTSETVDHPIDHVFDPQRGPGGSRWVAAEPGGQVLIFAFDTVQTIHRVSLEVEEREVSRTQELALSVSSDGGQTYRELRRQEYTFSPPGTTFEREDWGVTVEGITPE
jgi:hypothetical protein